MIALREAPDLARRALRGWLDDAGPGMGAALAFYTLLALAPLLLVGVGLAGFFLGRDEAQNALVAQVAALLGDGAAFGVESLLDAAGSREEGLTPALVGGAAMFIAAIAIFADLRSSLDRIWKCPRAAVPDWQHLASSAACFLLVSAAALLLLASLLASTFLAAARPQALDGSPAALHALEFLVSFVAMTGLFAVIHKALPSARVAWRDVWVGSAATALLFWVGKFAFALYLGRAAIGSGFGAAGAVVVIALWAYYSAHAFYLGAELVRHYALRHGSRRGEVAAAPTLAEMNAAYEELIERTRLASRGRLLGSDSG